ncbi:hypothetical protein GWC77_26265 [Paraburkholderia sp. NMBU_R16]|uniref:hypothetical protein n=1 Tax=Paraburkholderia sp. NMBU_R16 TaxID=2698676 RepID=UPI001563BF50|nr:hypothetical protein [Paraburkholderia sp. NMBU_R16]NRO99392.1 hypothetical protein [Paraburkholderia sp. NMBU_R16]
MSSYKTLRTMVNSGELSIISIIAPPRTSSTALERALIESPDISGQCNEPWSQPHVTTIEQRRQIAYDKIFSRVSQIRSASAKFDRRHDILVVKNIADFIPPGEFFIEWSSLARHQIFLVRDPACAIESELNIFFRDIRTDGKLFDGVTPNQYARTTGFKNWLALHRWAKDNRNYCLYEAPVNTYFANADLTHRDPKLIRLVSALRPNLDANEMFRFRILGWEALQEHLRECRTQASNYAVVESALFRSNPVAFLTGLCRILSITYTPRMIDWSIEKTKSFERGWDEHPDHFFYDQVLGSTGILPPQDSAPAIDRFPPCIQNFISRKDGANDIYREAIEDSNFLGP